jgi:hypothetical protein
VTLATDLTDGLFCSLAGVDGRQNNLNITRQDAVSAVHHVGAARGARKSIRFPQPKMILIASTLFDCRFIDAWRFASCRAFDRWHVVFVDVGDKAKRSH